MQSKSDKEKRDYYKKRTQFLNDKAKEIVQDHIWKVKDFIEKYELIPKEAILIRNAICANIFGHLLATLESEETKEFITKEFSKIIREMMKKYAELKDEEKDTK